MIYIMFKVKYQINSVIRVGVFFFDSSKKTQL
jgi:hypothetical protein